MKNLLINLPPDMSGKTVLIAGGTDAIGRKITLSLAEMGANIIVLGEKQNEVDNILSMLPCKVARYYGMAADPANPEDIRIILTVIDRQFRGVDVLINNNMFTFPQHAGETEVLMESLYARLKGQYICTREILQRMEKKSCPGYIINVNTIGNEFRRKYRDLCRRGRSAFRTFNTELCKEAGQKNVKVILSSL